MAALKLGGDPAETQKAAPVGVDEKFFIKKHFSFLFIVVAFVALNAFAAVFVNFDVLQAIMDLPGGFVWFTVNFMPTPECLDSLEKILPALLSTVLDSVAASCTAAILAYIFAVIGSRTVGLGGPVPLIVRAIASVFRNIPIVAWAFLLLFSFKQGEFTGYLALFLQSFGFLTRCFLESIDELALGPVEALKSSGATYLQIIVRCVIPMSITQVISWVLYMVETNIRDATLVGMLTGTGIGFVFDLYYKGFRYDSSGLVLVCVIVVVIACEVTSNFIRRKVM